MSNGLPEGKQMLIRSFYGFGPEEDGYVGWTQESARDSFMRKINDGDLLMIYGASSKETENALRSYVLGFVQVDATPIRDFEKASEDAMSSKREAGWGDKWTYAIPIRRAWRAEEKMPISRIAFKSYRPEAGQALAVHGTDLEPEEIAQALKIKVTEVSVFGEPPVHEGALAGRPFFEEFSPSRAFPGGTGIRTSVYEDGVTFLYLARFDGNGHALLGKPKSFGNKHVVLKIGVSNDPDSRAKQLNSGFPPAGQGQWKMELKAKFPDRKSAEAAEQYFKDASSKSLESLGGEFFWGGLDDGQLLFTKVPGVSRF